MILLVGRGGVKGHKNFVNKQFCEQTGVSFVGV